MAIDMNTPDRNSPDKSTLAHTIRYQTVRKVTLIGSAIDLVLGVAKMGIGFVANSQALVADGIHSLSDLLTDFMVLFAAKQVSRGADEEHPYGHARIETIFTVVLGLSLIAVAVGITYDAASRLFEPGQLLRFGWIALSVAVVSIVSKEWIYRYTMRVARELQSNLLKANAWHSRSDAISSIIVFAGIVGSMAGFAYLDAVAAIGVSLMIAKVGLDLGWHSMRELVDTGLESDRLAAIRKTILEQDGVEALHMLRTRKMGCDALVDVHILVDPRLSVSEGHQISEAVRARLINEIDEVSDVMVHIDPEDDEDTAPSCHLPGRKVLLARLQDRWRDIEQAQFISDVTLHYLDGKVEVDIVIPLSSVHDLEEAKMTAKALVRAARQDEDVRTARVHFT